MTREQRKAAAHVLAGGVLLTCGALLPMILPPAVLGVLVLLAVLRICWLGDNIAHDLAGHDRLPTGYVNAARRRQRAYWTAFRIAPSSDPQNWRPALVATRMRAEEQAWYILMLSAAAVMIGSVVSSSAPICWTATGFPLVLAMRQADRLAVTLDRLGSAQPLSRRDLLSRPAWVPGSRAGRGE